MIIRGHEVAYKDVEAYVEMHQDSLTLKDLYIAGSIHHTTHWQTDGPTDLSEWMIQNAKYQTRSWTSNTKYYVSSKYVFEIDDSYAGPGCRDCCYNYVKWDIDEWYETQYHELEFEECHNNE